ncbi:hypothetical protein A3J44_01020 [candidate division WOR-1 bacterium RIFCSPHIGHO2_02_FULL_45_12]|nr:MAG: hypothetical protein A3J44_01020 [candidate division WOR-1 bacterium RIFCSPHIGHO2_02_FULL_45_12]
MFSEESFGFRKFKCPHCSSELSGLVCPKCNKGWMVEGGIAKFVEQPAHWNLLAEEEMSGLISQAEKVGWAEAIKKSKSQKIRVLYPFTDCPTRADATFYLPLNEKSLILDLGSGWGNFSFALAPRVGQVVAADITSQALKFIHLRKTQDKIENITPVLIEPLDFGRLPFADNTFNAVIMNGVLEWVGSHLKTGDPLKLQEGCLRAVYQTLKNNGRVLIGIENRFGLKYFFGAQDDHLIHYSSQKISYTTLLPRIIANWITRKRISLPYRTYTHSLNGYKSLLKRAGFKDIEVYFPDPDYRAISAQVYPVKVQEVRKLLRASMKNELASLSRNMFWHWLFNNFILLIKLFKLEYFFCNSYLIIGVKR